MWLHDIDTAAQAVRQCGDGIAARVRRWWVTDCKAARTSQGLVAVVGFEHAATPYVADKVVAEQAGEDSASRWCPDDSIAQRRELRTLDGLPSLLQLACTLVEVLVKLGG